MVPPHAGDLAVLRTEPGSHQRRLVLVQHALLDVVDVLDAKGERVPMGMRERLRYPIPQQMTCSLDWHGTPPVAPNAQEMLTVEALRVARR